MTDEITSEEVTSEQAGRETKPAIEEDRFEVKWKKKGEVQSPTATAPPTEQTEGAPTVAELQLELEQERERVKNLQDRWQRAAADLANLRRRTEQERGELEKFATMVLVQELLPVLDNFERAIATIPGNLAMLTWVQGVILIERHLRAILEHQGLQPIEVQGQAFNPHLHEAIAERETSEATPGTILQAYQAGYTMHGRMIRPALVEVAKAAGEPSPRPEPTDQAEAETIAQEAEMENAGP
jgi:molecular chaperone GrpE